MSENTFITILIAEDNDVSREMMMGIMRHQGFKAIGAIDGESAIKVVDEHDIDLAFVDINMTPSSGFDFVRYLLSRSIKVPTVIVTADESSDILMEANSLGVVQVMQKPVVPERLIKTAHRILKANGLNPSPVAVETHSAQFTPEDLMKKTIALAARNSDSKRGGPYGAIVSDGQGKVLGEGVNGAGSRADPTAHAEVMAIRLAADKLGSADLSSCVLYCSSEPTEVGKALIKSVGLKSVYYGLSHDDIGGMNTKKSTTEPDYKQLSRDEALAMFQAAKS